MTRNIKRVSQVIHKRFFASSKTKQSKAKQNETYRSAQGIKANPAKQKHTVSETIPEKSANIANGPRANIHINFVRKITSVDLPNSEQRPITWCDVRCAVWKRRVDVLDVAGIVADDVAVVIVAAMMMMLMLMVVRWWWYEWNCKCIRRQEAAGGGRRLSLNVIITIGRW